MRRDELAIFKPQKTGNSPTAGGPRSNQKVINGKLNEVFDGISVIGYGQGTVEFAKVYPGVASNNTELLKSAHVYFSEAPQDPQVSMLIASAKVNDADLLDAMKSAVQVGRSVADLMGDLDEAILGQDRINSRLPVKAGDVVAICIEYSGATDPSFARATHFCQVTDVLTELYVTGVAAQQYVMATRQAGFLISPALPFALPAATQAINGQKPCAKLRRTKYDTSAVKFHGTTTLIANAASGATVLSVATTRASILPALTSTKSYTAMGQDSTNVELVRKVQVLPAQPSQTYFFPDTDLFTTPHAGIDPTVYVAYVAAGSLVVEKTTYAIAANGVTVSLRTRADAGTNVALSYLSSARYSILTANPFVLNSSARIVPGTVIGTVAKTDETVSVSDVAGQLIYTKVNNGLTEQVSAGTINYATGVVTLHSPWTNRSLAAVAATVMNRTNVQFVLPYPGVINSTIYISARTVSNQIVSCSGASDGSISGANVNGTITNGVVSLTFATAVDDSSIRLDFSATARLLPPAELYGINPVKLPDGASADIFHKWGMIVVSDTQTQTLATPAVGQTISGRAGAFITVRSADGTDLWSFTNEFYAHNKATGQIVLNKIAGVNLPLIITDTLSELVMVKSIAGNQLTLTTALSGTYPAGSTVSSVAILGDLQAGVVNVRDATAWDGDFELVGTPSVANLNIVDFPIQVTNNAAINEQWAIKFDSATAFKCYGMGVGMVGAGSIQQTFTPINPATSQPYFTIPQQAFGGGWSAGEVILFSTVAAAKPLILMRCVSPGHSGLEQDSMTLMFAGNA